MYPPSQRVRVTTPAQIAVIVRAQDGPFQAMVIGTRPDVIVYQLTGRVLRPVVPIAIGPALCSITDIEADVFVFLSVPVEALNHVCLDALASEASNPECGVVSATGVVPESLFAVRRELLASVGGLSRVSADRIPALFRLLTEDALAQQLRVTTTSRALATPAS
jgi:hypothetical protein